MHRNETPLGAANRQGWDSCVELLAPLAHADSADAMLWAEALLPPADSSPLIEVPSCPCPCAPHARMYVDMPCACPRATHVHVRCAMCMCMYDVRAAARSGTSPPARFLRHLAPWQVNAEQFDAAIRRATVLQAEPEQLEILKAKAKPSGERWRTCTCTCPGTCTCTRHMAEA